MKFKKSAVAVIGALALVVGLLAPVAASPPEGTLKSEGTGVIEVTSGGVFAVFICDVNAEVDFGSAAATTNMDATGYGSLFVCFTDTQVHRPGFGIQLTAGDWASETTDTPFAAQNLIPTFAYSPLSTQLTPNWDSGGWIWGNDGGGNAEHSVTNPTTDPAAVTSVPWLGGNLADPLGIGHSDAGRGTTETVMRLDLKLTVPANTLPGIYESEITVDILARAP